MTVGVRYDTNEGLVQEKGTGFDLPSIGASRVPFEFASSPDADDDVGSGFIIGHRWINTSTDAEYVCLDATSGVAVWKETTGAGSGGSGADPGASYVVIGATGSLANERALIGGTGINFVDGGANTGVTGSIDDSIVATVSGTTFTGNILAPVVSASLGFSGSLTRLLDGTSAFIAGANITITSASNGANTIASTGGGGSGPLGQTIWVADSSTTGSEYANGITYTPLRVGQDDTITYEFIVAASGTIETNVLYAMSGVDSGDIELRLDYLNLGIGSDPTTSITTQSAFTITPGSDTLIHSASVADSATLQIEPDEGDKVLMKLTRISGSNDTHVGDFRILEVRIK